MASGELSRINTNISALNALNSLNRINQQMNVHSLRLATGKRINSAADDAAGFTIAKKLDVRSQGLGVAIDNIGSAKNLMTVAEGHLTNISDILAKMKSKAQQAANDTLSTDERAAILTELQEMNTQINSEVEQAKWSGTALLDAGTTGLDFQIGAGITGTSDEMNFNVASQIWSGGSTTFDASGLDVEASGSLVREATETVVATSGVTAAVGTSSTINSNGSELATGSYTVEVSTVGATTGAEVTIKLLDSQGRYVAIDDNGTASAGEVDNELVYTLTGTNAGSLDLGVGITVDLSAVATASGATTSASYSVEYSRAGNSVDSQDHAQTFMTNIDDAIDKVSSALTYIGSSINRLTYQQESLSIAMTNTEAAHARIVDADMAYEQLESTKLQILQQTATAMLAQANGAPQAILGLFR